MERLRKATFNVPADFRAEDLVGRTFGLIPGPNTEVRLRFDRTVARVVRRRRWHPSQQFSDLEDGRVEMEMSVDGTTELISFILGFGGKVEVLSPESLREEMGRELVMAEQWPIGNRIIADDAGYVWLERFEAPEGPSGNWVVVDGTGDVVAELTLPDGLRLLDVGEDHVIGVWSDELDRQEVRVHALERDRRRETRLAECR